MLVPIHSLLLLSLSTLRICIPSFFNNDDNGESDGSDDIDDEDEWRCIIAIYFRFFCSFCIDRDRNGSKVIVDVMVRGGSKTFMRYKVCHESNGL